MDDPEELAILWERQDGIFLTGCRGRGHAVGTASGGYIQVPPEQWDEFLREQEKLRREVLEGRKSHLPGRAQESTVPRSPTGQP